MDSDEFLMTLPDNIMLMALEPGQTWKPQAVGLSHIYRASYFLIPHLKLITTRLSPFKKHLSGFVSDVFHQIQGSVVLNNHKPRTGRDIARVTFDLYKLNPRDLFGSLSVKATYQGLYSVSADFQCLGPKKVLR